MNMTSEYTFRISQQGGEQLRVMLKGMGIDFQETKAAADGATSAIASHGKETNALTQFIHTQRTAQREQSFMFREGRQSIMLLSMGMMMLGNSNDGADASTKKFNKSIMESIIAFQAADFAIAALGIASGGTAIAIAGIIAAGVGLSSFYGDSTKAAEEFNKSLKTQTDMLLELGLISKSEVMKKIAGQLSEESLKLSGMKIGATVYGENFENVGGVSKQEYTDQINKVLGLQKEYKKLWDENAKDEDKFNTQLIDDIEEEALRLWNLNEDEAKDNKADLDALEDKRKAMARIYDMVADIKEQERKQQEEFLSRPLGSINAKQFDLKQKDALIDIVTDEKERNKLLKERAVLQTKLNLMQKTDEELTGMLLDETQNAFSTMGNIIVSLGGNTDNWFSKLGQVLQVMQEIKAATEAIKAIEEIVGFLGLFHGGGILTEHIGGILTGHSGLTLPTTYGGRKEVLFKGYAGEEIIPEDSPRHRNNMYTKGYGGIGATINFNIYANDAQSFNDYINQPVNRRAIINTMMRGLQGMN
jgi:hypothetical protein